MTDRLLVLVRHGQSEWNLKNLFTGWRDVDLTEQGVNGSARGRPQAQGARAHVRRRLHLGAQARAAHARPDAGGAGPEQHSGHQGPGAQRARLRRLSGLNKDDARKKWGEEQVHIWRRSYDIAPPGGESLRDTAARVLPYYIQEILPRVLRGERVLVSAHGNSLRALVMVLERLTPEQHPQARDRTGVPIIYRLNADSTVASKLDLAA